MIKIICVGKIKEKYIKIGIEDYIKRIKKYTKIELIEVNDEVNNILEKEKESINKYINQKDYLIILDIDGLKINSNQLAEKIDKTFISYPNITFVIGGSYGISDELKNEANYLLSFSDLTFPHQLFRLILLEQIYRSFKINNNEKYHK